MKRGFIYDIRTSENALSTLVNFTGVLPPIWEECMLHRKDFNYEEDFVEWVIDQNGHFPVDYEKWFFVYFHVTTSANGCASFEKYGILDLPNSYQCSESELRQFLENKGIHIDLNNHSLEYKDRTYDISYGGCPSRFDTIAYACWAVGRKFYYDFTTCGFLSVWDKCAYGGNVHCRPEILSDIDMLLGLSLSQEWHITHEAYEIVAIVPGTDIIYDGDDDQSNKEKVVNYLTKAYLAAFGAPHEEIVLLKNHVQIPVNRIIEINPLSCW